MAPLSQIEPRMDLRCEQLERQRVTDRHKLTPFALAAAITLATVACDGESGARQNGAAPTRVSPTVVPETPAGLSFGDPRTDGGASRNLFEVKAEDGEYWRMFTLDRFDGESWMSADPDGSEGGIPLSAPASLPTPGGHPPRGAETLDQTFRILSEFDSAHALLMAQTAEEIEGPFADITWDPARSQAFIDGPLEAGMVYTVRSRIVVPTPEELDRVDHLAPRAIRQWTELPADLDPRIGEIAERWTADATSDYRKVLAIQQRFHAGSFVYSTDVDTGVDADSLLQFLTRTKSGFCQHYSSAMVVMVRELGLPARIGVGFRTGTRQEGGSYLVKTTDAHVWVEVLFADYGWLQFEPEPGPAPHPNAQPGSYLNPIAPTDPS